MLPLLIRIVTEYRQEQFVAVSASLPILISLCRRYETGSDEHQKVASSVLDAGREYDDSRQHNVVYNVHVFLWQHVARLS